MLFSFKTVIINPSAIFSLKTSNIYI
jgi:hypothetical protein